MHFQIFCSPGACNSGVQSHYHLLKSSPPHKRDKPIVFLKLGNNEQVFKILVPFESALKVLSNDTKIVKFHLILAMLNSGNALVRCNQTEVCPCGYLIASYKYHYASTTTFSVGGSSVKSCEPIIFATNSKLIHDRFLLK